MEFHRSLSPETVYQRYLHMLGLDARTAHERLIRICFLDYDRELALVAEHVADDGRREIAGIGRLSKDPMRATGEFAVLVGDPWQGHGLGGELLERIIAVARGEGLERLSADIAATNTPHDRARREARVHVSSQADDEGLMRADLELDGSGRRGVSRVLTCLG